MVRKQSQREALKLHNRAPQSPARALLVIDQPLLAGVVEMALNHGTYTTRVVLSTPEAAAVLQEWQPHLAVVDMDVDDGEIVMKWIDQTQARTERIPVVALTRRGDLHTSVREVSHPAREPQPPGALPHKPPEADALHRARHADVQSG